MNEVLCRLAFVHGAGVNLLASWVREKWSRSFQEVNGIGIDCQVVRKQDGEAQDDIGI